MNQSERKRNNMLKLADLKTPLDIDLYCKLIVTDEGFFPAAALQLLNSIVDFCIIEKITDEGKLTEIVNSEITNIIAILSKYKKTEYGLNLLKISDRTTQSILYVLRQYMNDEKRNISGQG